MLAFRFTRLPSLASPSTAGSPLLGLRWPTLAWLPIACWPSPPRLSVARLPMPSLTRRCAPLQAAAAVPAHAQQSHAPSCLTFQSLPLPGSARHRTARWPMPNPRLPIPSITCTAHRLQRGPVAGTAAIARHDMAYHASARLPSQLAGPPMPRPMASRQGCQDGPCPAMPDVSRPRLPRPTVSCPYARSDPSRAPAGNPLHGQRSRPLLPKGKLSAWLQICGQTCPQNASRACRRPRRGSPGVWTRRDSACSAAATRTDRCERDRAPGA